MNHKGLLQKAHAAGIKHGFLNYWVAALMETLETPSTEMTFAEFGGFGTDFLRLVEFLAPYRTAYVTTLPGDSPDAISEASSLTERVTLHVSPHQSPDSPPPLSINLAYAFEVFSLVPDLDRFAEECFRSLAPTGAFYATFAWHAENPLSERTKELRESQDRTFASHRLEDVANAFQTAGFEVAIKRPRIPFFLVCNDNTLQRRYGSIEAMVQNNYEDLYLFSFRKLAED
jgi:hypothetical protein